MVEHVKPKDTKERVSDKKPELQRGVSHPARWVNRYKPYRTSGFGLLKEKEAHPMAWLALIKSIHLRHKLIMRVVESEDSRVM